MKHKIKKICTVCKIYKSENEFYLEWNWNKTRKKLKASCKECLIIKKKKRYKENPEKYKKLSYRWNKTHHKSRLETYRKYAKNNKEKLRARDLLKYAVDAGKIERQPCVICGKKKSEGHHPDYSKPLDVIWLCSKHHAKEHSKGELQGEGVE